MTTLESLRQLATTRRSFPDQQTRLSESELAALVDGEVVAERLILAESFFPFGTLHGEITLQGNLANALALFGNKTDNRNGAVVFMDTETTGLAGGTGTLVFQESRGQSR